jgi:hypothetical protein
MAEQGRQFLLFELASVLSGVADRSGATAPDELDAGTSGKMPRITWRGDFIPPSGDISERDGVGEEEVEVWDAAPLPLDEPEG